MISRRTFLRTGALAAGALAMPSFLRAQPGRIPIAQTWTGDEFDLPHELLQAGPHDLPAGVLGGEPERRVDVIVVGAGVSGLAAAFALGDRSVLLLESASQLGGNAKKGSWKGIDYALGSAYLIKPEPEEPLAKFYSDTGADKVWRVSSEGGVAFHRHRLVSELWENGTTPANRDAFRRARDYFVWIWENAYADVPFDPGGCVEPERVRAARSRLLRRPPACGGDVEGRRRDAKAGPIRPGGPRADRVLLRELFRRAAR